MSHDAVEKMIVRERPLSARRGAKLQAVCVMVLETLASFARPGQPRAAVPTNATYWTGTLGAAAAAGGASAMPSLTRSLSSLLGLKKGIFLAGTSTRSPVLGLRPTRGRR